MEGEVAESAAGLAQDELSSQFERLDSLSEEELLTLIGSASITLPEYSNAAVRAYAPDPVLAALEREQMVVTGPIDLALRGRRTVRRILDEWRDQLRAKICPLREKGASALELALEIAGILASVLLAGIPGLLAALSVVIAKHFLEELCKSREPVPQESPAPA